MPRNAPPLSLLALFALSVAACRTAAPAVQTAAAPNAPAQLAAQNTDATIYQHFSAEAYRLYQQGYELAKIRLDANLARPHTLPPAVIVDIDETVLDNSPYQVTNAANDRSYSPESWKAWTAKASARALPGAVEFLDYAVSRGCEVFYISNREVDEEAATVRNLAAQGFPMADTTHVVPMQGTSDKTARRAAVAQTHSIVLLVGDQLRDFDEGFKDRSVGNGKPMVDAQRDTLERYFIMLPNPMYGTWLDALSGKDAALRPATKQQLLRKNAY